MLAQIESDRASGKFGYRDEVLEQVLDVVESREQLDRLFVPLGECGAEVADRVDAFLRFGGSVVERNDQELVEFALAHLMRLRDLAAAGLEVREGAVGLIDAFVQLGVEVVDDVANGALVLNGFGEEPTFDSLPPEPVGADQAHRLAGLDGLLVEENRAVLASPAEHAEMESIFNSLTLQDYPYVGRWLMAAALAADGLVFDCEPWFRLWEANAVLWATPSGVRITRGDAPRFAFEAYQPDKPIAPPVVIGEVRERWLQTAGENGTRALELVDRCAAERANELELLDLGLTSLPPGLDELEHLELLNVAGNAFDALPVEVLEMGFLGRLGISNCGLTELPEGLADAFPNLWLVNANSNALTEFPESFTSMTGLRRLSAARNQLVALPDDIGAMVNLEHVSLDRNQFTEIPASIANLQNLTFISFSRNPLESLPPEILQLPDLAHVSVNCLALPETVRFANNRAELMAAWPSEWGPLPT